MDTTPAATPNRQGGFTIIELIVVIAIIGILAGIALPRLTHAPTRAREAVLKTNLRAMRDAINQYYADEGHYPPSLDALVDEGYLRDIPYDPIARSSDTWVVEYEEIDPDYVPAETDEPEGGEPGIIDVFSGSEDLSDDGTPYSEW
jgi:general secretion pathway protein G